MFDVQCSMFDVLGDNNGTSNIQHPTSNIQHRTTLTVFLINQYVVGVLLKIGERTPLACFGRRPADRTGRRRRPKNNGRSLWVLIARNADAAGRRVQHAGGVCSPSLNTYQHLCNLEADINREVDLNRAQRPRHHRSSKRRQHPRDARPLLRRRPDSRQRERR